MALKPGIKYPSQTDVDGTNYPLGKARNVSSAGAGDGTPLEKDWVNDLWGFLQALLADAGITASGNPDTAVASQYLDSIKACVPNRVVDIGFLVGSSLIAQNFSGGTPVVISNSTMVTNVSLLSGDIVMYDFTTMNVDNSTPAADANLLVQHSQNGGAFSTVLSYLVPQNETHDITPTGIAQITTPGLFSVRLAGTNGSVSNTRIEAYEQNKLVGRFIVYRP